MLNCKQCGNEINDAKVCNNKRRPRMFCTPCNKSRHILAVRKYQARKEAVNME